MKTKAVYVLISQETDYHLERLLLSAYSLRVHNPDMGIVIVTDPETKERLAGAELPNHVEIVAVIIPDKYQQMQKSRFLKTRLREFVSGPFLYLDTDTLICGSLEDVDIFDVDLALVTDRNRKPPLLAHTLPFELCQKAGFDDLEGKPYYNSGIMFVSDSTSSKQFFENWHHRWTESLENGISLDQPALCMANVDTGLLIRELPGVYNWQVLAGAIPDYENARIIHYYGCRIGRRLLPEHLRQHGIDNQINRVVLASPYRIYSLFSAPDAKLCEFLTSDMLGLFLDYPNFYNIAVPIVKSFLKPYIWLSTIKDWFHKHH